jgi:hypothetical protein
MRKSPRFALPGLALLALAATAADPVSAEPLPLDEGALGGVAAGADAIPGMRLSTSEVSNTSNSTTSTNSVASTISQVINGAAHNTNYSTGMSSQNVVANGNAFSTATGAIAR